MQSVRVRQLLCILALVGPPGTIIGVSTWAQPRGPAMPNLPAPPSLPPVPRLPNPPPAPAPFPGGPFGDRPAPYFNTPTYVYVCSKCKGHLGYSWSDTLKYGHCPYCGVPFIGHIAIWCSPIILVIIALSALGQSGLLAQWIDRQSSRKRRKRKSPKWRSAEARQCSDAKNSRSVQPHLLSFAKPDDIFVR